MSRVFATEEIESSTRKPFNEESEEKDVDCQKSAVHAYLSDVSTDSFQFLLERCCFYSLFKFGHDFTDTADFSNYNDNKPSFASSELST